MKIQISFNYKSKTIGEIIPFRATIDEKDIDLTHYENFWDAWIDEKDNEILSKDFQSLGEEDDMVFEVNADKCFPDGCGDNGIISGRNMIIYVYNDNYEDDSISAITDIDIRYL